MLGNYNEVSGNDLKTRIIPISKLLGNYNPRRFAGLRPAIIPISKLLGNYNLIICNIPILIVPILTLLNKISQSITVTADSINVFEARHLASIAAPRELNPEGQLGVIEVDGSFFGKKRFGQQTSKNW